MPPTPAPVRIGDLPPAERPLEKLALLGADQLADAELLAAVLGGGVRGRSGLQLAHDALLACGGLGGVSRRGLAELQRLPGIGPVRAARLQAALELGRRAASAAAPLLLALADTRQVVDYFRPRLAGLDHERLYAVLLDARNRVFRIELVARGGLVGLSVQPREVLGLALRESAAGLILVHNHPSGDPTPSRADREFTERLAAAAEVVGLRLLDHVVVGREGGRSVLAV